MSWKTVPPPPAGHDPHLGAPAVLHGSGAVRGKQDVAEPAAFRVQGHDDDGFAAAEGGLAPLGCEEAVEGDREPNCESSTAAQQ